MKQLKIVQPLVNTSNPFFVANFTESIEISPNSRIWFDKISFNIISSGPGGSIQLGDQTLLMSPNVINGPNSIPTIQLFLAAATYPSIDDLYNALQKLLNGVLYSNPTNVLSGKMPDTGLAFLVNPDPDHADSTEISFVQAPTTKQLNAQAIDIVLQDSYWWTPTNPFPSQWSLIYPTPILAGALQCSTAVYMPDRLDFLYNSVFVGLYTQSGLGPIYNYERKFGFFLNEDYTWRFYNNGELSYITDQSVFRSDADPPNRFMTWYVDPNDRSNLKAGVFEKIGDNPITQLLTSPNGTFDGYDVNINYFWGADGFYTSGLPVRILDPDITYQPHVVLDNTGWALQTGRQLNRNYKGLTQQTWGYQQPYPTLSDLGPRRVRLDFSQALALMQGLGFTTIVNNIVGFEGAIYGSNPVGFLNFFDLALDCYNFTLDSFMSSTKTKGRVAAVAYFVPTPTSSISGQSLFYAENKQLTFIDIKNKQKQVIESLNFRIYNPQNPEETFVLSNVSFTLFIEGGDVEEDGVLVRLA